MICADPRAAGLLSSLPNEVLCAELAQPPSAANGTLPPPTEASAGLAQNAQAASPSKLWLLLTDGILPECCEAVSSACVTGDVLAHIHQLNTMTACLKRIAGVLQVRSCTSLQRNDHTRRSYHTAPLLLSAG
jgi:hypothetical protein